MAGDGVVVGCAVSPRIIIMIILCFFLIFSPSTQVVFPFDFWETFFDTRNRSNEFQEAIS